MRNFESQPSQILFSAQNDCLSGEMLEIELPSRSEFFYFDQ